MIDKPTIRRHMRTRRRQQTAREQHRATQQFLQNGIRILHRQRSVALFMPFDGEPNVGPLLSELLKRHRIVAMPRIDRRQKPQMHFVCHGNRTKMTKNRFGIAEPVNTRRLRLSEIDVILLPLTAFDAKGNRLGMGAGFYDRALQSRKGRLLRKPRLVGVAFDWQEIAELPSDPWDLPLHAVLTNKKIIQIKRTTVST